MYSGKNNKKFCFLFLLFMINMKSNLIRCKFKIKFLDSKLSARIVMSYKKKRNRKKLG